MSYNAYLWFKFIHFAAFISWMAMLFYLPRLYVYHAENKDKPEFVSVVKTMEKMLFHAIGWIALGLTLFSAIVIIVFAKPELMKMGYFHLKLLCGVLMIAYHFWLYYYLKKFEKGECNKNGKFFRALNEIPTLIMFVILYAMLIMPYK
ncbi:MULTISPECIES: protoporphyrinogen oxidase HemJ [unclassified Campylobacter]|uniref:protoporphyrinogen oxidase HemJ n=1 Tax=unclassified Campylobacter TaxID=2593542 RepID=UPI0022E9D58A|nr:MULTISPECIES: protoporphyrinogen oxidase HemJ [unclassified Campylobacter]MBQ3674906.1 protoporphyrinogen oxidase HemJ [Campylobacter sp.]MBQ6223559.1 protoporphyrinogen oxidase HemJ [Campylobacter sp.]MBQ7271629.1 protoporphyrinogen oxidase HemJ [Campylobacter sp.]MBQ9875493.1 protoporphyrinogen oxidase HemJ [Campylobacter sp.]MBR0071164.1 protoporphyrinogen oxidase HemJ [Campylobacter sp.]